MIQPNSAAAGFTYWMLNISQQHLSGPQRLLTQQIYNAAISNTPVSNQDWYNFNLFAAWRNPYYLVYKDYAVVTAPDLLFQLISSYNFDGNSNDPVSGNNGTDTSITYSTAAGKINQGAIFAGSPAEIDITPITPGATYSVGLWLKPSALGSGFQAVMGNNADFTGLYLDKATYKLDWVTSGDTNTMSAISPSVYTCIVVTCDASYVRIYLNGVLDVVSSAVTGFPIIAVIGTNRTGNRYTGDMDILNFWDRALSPDEIAEFYNAGAGIQYPF